MFRASPRTCVCHSGQQYWETSSESIQFDELNKLFSLPDASSQTVSAALTPFACPSFEITVDPLLPSLVHSESCLIPDLQPAQAWQTNPDSATSARLELLERTVEQLQHPLGRQQSDRDSRLDILEGKAKETLSQLANVQHSISSLEVWAEKMNDALKEFKAAVCDLYKLVDARQHLLDTNPSAETLSRKSLAWPFLHCANLFIR